MGQLEAPRACIMLLLEGRVPRPPPSECVPHPPPYLQHGGPVSKLSGCHNRGREVFLASSGQECCGHSVVHRIGPT